MHENSHITESVKAITELEQNSHECYYKSRCTNEYQVLGTFTVLKSKKVTKAHKSYSHRGHVEISNHNITILSVID